MKLFTSILLLFAGNELSVNAEPTEVWVNVNGDDNGFELFRKDTSQSLTTRDDSLFYTFYLDTDGCGNAANFGVFIDDKPDGQKWHKVRYTLEFVRGGASCYSLFGDTHYGDFGVDTLGLTTLYVKENALTTGDYNGLPKRICDNEDSNFLHIKHGYETNRGYMRVEQDRDLNVAKAGIGAGFGCIEYGTMIILKDVQVAYYEDSPKLYEQWVDIRKYELLTDTPRTWDEAQSACQERFGTDLASIHSLADQNAAYQLCQSKGGDAHCYIGLRRDSDDETSWQWSDGSTVDYGSDFSGGVFPWSQGEPNYLKISGIGRQNEDCAEMVMPNDGEWNDIPCDGRLYALCNAVGSSYEVFKTNTAIELLHNADGGLEVDAELRQQLVGSHCSAESSSNFGLIIGDLEDQKWHKIRYTLEFVSGASSCWSLFGDTRYGPFGDDADFGLTTLDVIENTLTVGEWNGEKKLCNNEKSNFMHSSNGVGNKGYLTVEQDRDMNVDVAGISAGFSCISAGQVVRVKDISVAYLTEQWVDVRKYELLTDTKRTWSDAQAACQETFGTDLASIHSLADYDAAYEICQSKGADCWIGLHRNSEDASGWKWSDGSTVDFGSDYSGSVFPWADGEPNDFNHANGVGEECAEMRLVDSFEWNDSQCEAHQYALCNAVGSSYEFISANTEIELFHNADGGLKVDGELQQRGCGSGESSSFGLIIDDLENQKWHKIRYTIEFVSGASSCFSLFGDTHYGQFGDDADFGLTTLNVIDNGLNVGEWNGEKKLCNNEKSNFMHRINGVGNKGYLTVEQDRDLSVERAGISSGFACTDVGQIVRYKDISVAYWREE